MGVWLVLQLFGHKLMDWNYNFELMMKTLD